jgi:hypothetical protein
MTFYKVRADSNKTAPVTHNKVDTLDSDIAKKEHIATYYSADYVTITTARGLELYDKSEPKRLV